MNFSNYLEYFLTLKNTFLESNKLIEADKQNDKEFEKVFLDNLLKCVTSAWKDYELSERDTYLLSEDELDSIWINSRDEILSATILKLSELGYIKMGVNENGEVVYSLSELGRRYISSI